MDGSTQQQIDERWMRRAIALAAKAELAGEVPVGAVLVKGDVMLGEGYNQPIGLNDPSAHAEMQALRKAAVMKSNYRLPGTTLYVTLEPCPMCAGLMVHSRIARLVYAASDAKTGAAGSIMNLLQDDRLNHQVEVVSGVLAEPCSAMLSEFFRRRRQAIKAEKLAARKAQN